MNIYTPKVRQILDSDEMVDFIGPRLQNLGLRIHMYHLTHLNTHQEKVQ